MGFYQHPTITFVALAASSHDLYSISDIEQDSRPHVERNATVFAMLIRCKVPTDSLHHCSSYSTIATTYTMVNFGLSSPVHFLTALQYASVPR